MNKKNVLIFRIFIWHIVFFLWLLLLILFRSAAIFNLIYENIYLFTLIISICSIISSVKGFGKFVFYKLVSEKYKFLIYLISFLIWVQFGIEWGTRVNGINYEPFMRYEPFAVVFSLPIGIVVLIVNEFIPISIKNMYIEAFVLWIAYFISFYFQLFFLIRYFQKKK